MKYLLFSFILILSACTEDVKFFSEGVERSQEDRDISCMNGQCQVTEFFELNKIETVVDILFILDVSDSMEDNLRKIGDSMSSLLLHIDNFDWQMAFTTADHGDRDKNSFHYQDSWRDYLGKEPWFGQFMSLEHNKKLLNQKILTPETKSYKEIFSDTLTRNNVDPCSMAPFCQSALEQPLRVLKSVIERNSDSQFFRSKSDFVSIIITNDDERSEDQEKATKVEDVKNTFDSYFKETKNFYAFNILIPPGDSKCRENQEKHKKKGKSLGTLVKYGHLISKLAEITQGKNISICQEDYGDSLKIISKTIKEKVLSRVVLSGRIPKVNSIRIKMVPQQNIGWEVEGRNIIFDSALQYGTELVVEYLVADF